MAFHSQLASQTRCRGRATIASVGTLQTRERRIHRLLSRTNKNRRANRRQTRTRKQLQQINTTQPISLLKRAKNKYFINKSSWKKRPIPSSANSPVGEGASAPSKTQTNSSIETEATSSVKEGERQTIFLTKRQRTANEGASGSDGALLSIGQLASHIDVVNFIFVQSRACEDAPDRT